MDSCLRGLPFFGNRKLSILRFALALPNKRQYDLTEIRQLSFLDDRMRFFAKIWRARVTMLEKGNMYTVAPPGVL